MDENISPLSITTAGHHESGMEEKLTNTNLRSQNTEDKTVCTLDCNTDKQTD